MFNIIYLILDFRCIVLVTSERLSGQNIIVQIISAPKISGKNIDHSSEQHKIVHKPPQEIHQIDNSHKEGNIEKSIEVLQISQSTHTPWQG